MLPVVVSICLALVAASGGEIVVIAVATVVWFSDGVGSKI